MQMIIIGSGPGGLTAAIYAARADLAPLVVAGVRAPSGQLTQTSEIENFPGFPEGISGPELMSRMREQAVRFGTRWLEDDVKSVDFSVTPLRVNTEGQTLETDTVIISTGASARWLGLPSERRLRGRGVSACATCDGFFFRNREVVVVGGGDTALEEALFLTKFATKVTISHRRRELRASKIMQERARSSPKIDFAWDSVVDEVIGEEQVEAVRLRDVVTGETRDLRTDGVFVAIGHTPNTSLFEGQIELDENGYIKAWDGTRTSVPGVFVAGDVADNRYRQAITAAGSGCKAAIDAERYLEGLP